MGSTKKVIYSGREFVNKKGEDDTGYIQAEIKWENNYGFEEDDWDYGDITDKPDSDGLPGHLDYKLKFADCNRIIDFNIGGGSEESRANALYKVDKMLEVLTGFRKGLLEAFIAEEYIKNFKKAKKEESNAKHFIEHSVITTSEDIKNILKGTKGTIVHYINSNSIEVEFIIKDISSVVTVSSSQIFKE